MPSDPTLVGAATDISRLGRDLPKPAHERTAAEEAGSTDSETIGASERFQLMLRA